MFKDSILDGLGATRDRAFRELKEARDRRSDLARRCSQLHDDLDSAFRRQSNAFNSMQARWSEHKSFMSDCSQRIEFYKAEADRQHAEMVRCFQAASNAHDAHDGAVAKSWADSGHQAQAMMRSAKEEFSRCISQSKDSKFRFESSGYKVDFENAKTQTARLKAEFSEAAEKLKTAKDVLAKKQAEFDKASQAFSDRLNLLKGLSQREIDDRRNRIEVVKRDSDNRKRRALEVYNRQQTGRDLQDGDKRSDVYVTVTAGWSRDYNMPTTDVIVRDKSLPGRHYHLVIGENGEFLINSWRADH